MSKVELPTMNIASVDGMGKDEPEVVEIACATSLHEITTQTPAEVQWESGKQEWLIVICLGVVSLMVALDATIIVPALPNIASSIKANAVQTFWFGSAYLLPYAVSQSLIASLSDIFGRRELLLLSVTCFFVGSIVTALAHRVIQMLVGRVIQGIGGGGIVCLTSIIVTDIIPLRQRAAFLAIPQLAWAIGTILGPLLGGALAQHWRWCFWINLPFAGLGILMIPLVVRLKHKDRLSLRSKLASVDYVGIMLFTSGITVFLVGLSWGGNEFTWNSYQTLLPLVLGATVTALSLYYETRFARSPFIKLSIYNNYSSVLALVAAFLQGLIMYSGLYAWNIYFQGVLGKSPIGTGVALLPIMLSTIPSSIITGQVLRRGVDFRRLILPSWTLLLVGNGLSVIWFVNTPTAAWAVTQLVCGFAQGSILIAGVIAIQSHVEAEDVGHAAAMYSFLRGLGLAVGVSISGTFLQNRLHYWLIFGQLPPHIAEDITAYIITLNTLPESQYTAAVRLAIARAHRNWSEAAVGFTVLGLLLMLKLRKGDMNKDLASKQRIEKKEQTDAVILKDVTNGGV